MHPHAGPQCVQTDKRNQEKLPPHSFDLSIVVHVPLLDVARVEGGDVGGVEHLVDELGDGHDGLLAQRRRCPGPTGIRR